MATFTANYNLRKPASTDLVDEDADLNDNWDIVDAEIKERQDEIADHESRLDVIEADSGWITTGLTYGTNWSGTITFRKIKNVVYIKGDCSRSSGSSANPYTLPAGYRPSFQLDTMIRNAGAMIAFVVGTSGVTTVGGAYVNGDTLQGDGLIFLVD